MIRVFFPRRALWGYGVLLRCFNALELAVDFLANELRVARDSLTFRDEDVCENGLGELSHSSAYVDEKNRSLSICDAGARGRRVTDTWHVTPLVQLGGVGGGTCGASLTIDQGSSSAVGRCQV